MVGCHLSSFSWRFVREPLLDSAPVICGCSAGRQHAHDYTSRPGHYGRLSSRGATSRHPTSRRARRAPYFVAIKGV
jgi:hypothetical protein